MNKKILFLLALLPLWTGSSLVVKDGKEEVATVVTHDGVNRKEVITEKKLAEEAGGYTKVNPEEVREMKTNPEADLQLPPLDPNANPRGNLGIVRGMTEAEVEAVASRRGMGRAAKGSEYLTGGTYPVRTYIYEFKTGNLYHSYKIYFDADGKVIDGNHQFEQY